VIVILCDISMGYELYESEVTPHTKMRHSAVQGKHLFRLEGGQKSRKRRTVVQS